MFDPDHLTDVAYKLTIIGLVQGVGFRPFVYRLANELKIKGWVKNTNYALIAHIQGPTDNIESFVHQLREQKPHASRIDKILSEKSDLQNLENFTIVASEILSDEVTNISPDIAVCDHCLEDLIHHPRRINYPLVNCCHCGPRFSIIKGLPYDREQTTMQSFKICDNCKVEYNNPYDRRFHAQPIACNDCGPVYQLHLKDEIITNLQDILNHLSLKISKGRIFAFKGVGGFQLACDALNDEAVQRLRIIKQRDTKPFAVMFKNLEILKKYAYVSSAEEIELLSFRKPILILNELKSLAPNVSLNLGTIGAMLPYIPFHYLLFNHQNLEVLVMTSGNISDEPIIIDNRQAINIFLDITDGVLTYNRDIYNRLDDSVVSVVNDKPRLIRRSRGFVPSPINLSCNSEGIFASGAELTGTFCIGKQNQAIMSQYFGDLQNYENFMFYSESYERFKKLFRFEPKIAVTDMHPDYVPVKFAQQLGIPVEYVQHHHAHIGSVMAEHEINEPVIGVAFDGTGFGTDGNIWGSEFLICDAINFKRVAHFEYMPLPGGDKAVLQPWRSAIAYLYKIYGKNLLNIDLQILKKIDKKNISIIIEAIEKGINTPFSCSAGRLFDAVATICNICTHPTFHAETPMRLEAAINKFCDGKYPFSYKNGIISFDAMWPEIISDLKGSNAVQNISSKFHNTIIDVIVYVCKVLRKDFGLNTVVLSGGTFQNRYLLEKAENILSENIFKVYSNQQFPSNDGGIALGQLYITAKKLENYVPRDTRKN